MNGFREKDSSLTGLPICVFERIVTIQRNQLERILCGSKDKDHNALKGISSEFLKELGIND